MCAYSQASYFKHEWNVSGSQHSSVFVTEWEELSESWLCSTHKNVFVDKNGYPLTLNAYFIIFDTNA